MFCDYCDCEGCQFGDKLSYHAQTAHGAWICHTCYTYDVCTEDGPMRSRSGPCKEKDCPHRPMLITDWIKFKE